MGPSDRFPCRESAVGSLQGAADDRVGHGNRNRGVTRAGEPAFGALGNESVALAARDDIVPLVLLARLPGARIAIVNLCLRESLPAPQVMLD
jgi:hypothetical protein